MKHISMKMIAYALVFACILSLNSLAQAQTGGTDSNLGHTGTDSNIGHTGTDSNSSGTFFLQNPLNGKFNTVGGLVSGFIEIFTYLVIIAGVLMIIYVGLRFVLAMGNPEEIKKRREQMMWLVIGLAIVIGARVIVMVVLNTLKATDTVSPGIIQSASNAINQTNP